MSAKQNYLVFRVGRQDFLVDTRSVRCVVPVRGLRPLPHQLPWIAGTVLINGWEAPAIDIRYKLNIATGASGRQPVIVVVQMNREDGPRWLGLLAERAGEIVSLQEDDFRNNAARISGRSRQRIDPDELLSADELRAIIDALMSRVTVTPTRQ